MGLRKKEPAVFIIVILIFGVLLYFVAYPLDAAGFHRGDYLCLHPRDHRIDFHHLPGHPPVESDGRGYIQHGRIRGAGQERLGIATIYVTPDGETGKRRESTCGMSE